MSQARRYQAPAPRPLLLRGLMLYFLPLPLLPAAIGALLSGEALVALARAAGFAGCIVAANLIRRGIRLEQQGKQRRLRRRASTVPYRLIGSLVLSASMFVLAWIGIQPYYGLLESVLFAGAALAGCYLHYDFDPARRKPDIAAIGITTEELVELLDEADARIDRIEADSHEIRNAEFRNRLRRIVREARAILDTIERDPVDARRARKFLKVYLDGAQQVTEGYARLHRDEDTPALEDNFRRVLATIETVIHEQQEKLAENNASDLDVKIEVLQLQLDKEGIS